MHYKFIASSATEVKKIPKFAELIRGIRQRSRSKMLAFKATIPKKRGSSLVPILPLIPTTLPITEDDKGSYLSFELKTRVGQPDAQSKYKKYVRKFEEGEPQQWINLKRDINEIWTQNSVNGGTDRASTVRALLKGESLTAFETSLEEARTADDGTVAAITPEHVTTAMEAVAQTVFPHRALETQKLWMNRSMFKPRSLTTRATSAAISRINNALPHFPEGTDGDKFSEVTLVGMLEWSLPALWREQFDLKGYIPTQHDRKRLIAECEAIERHVQDEKPDKETGAKKKKKRSSNERSTEKTDKNKFYCSEHGHNPTHSTSDCYTLKNREKHAKKVGKPTENRSFSNKAFRKELNMLSRKSSKKKVLDLYSTAIKKEKAKLAAKTKKAKAKDDVMSDESESDESVCVIDVAEEPPIKKRKEVSDDEDLVTKQKKRLGKAMAVFEKHRNKKKKNTANDETTLEEEKAYKRKVAWLKDHGESDANDSKDSSTNKDDSE